MRYTQPLHLALIIYDYLLMFDDEIRLFWCWKPWRTASLFFVCVRISLFVVAASVLFMAAIYDEHDEASYGVSSRPSHYSTVIRLIAATS